MLRVSLIFKKRAKGLFALHALLLALGTNVQALAESSIFPAREILQAIKQLEAKDMQDSPIHVHFDYRRANPSAPLVEWDPFAAPFSVKSWLMFNLDDAMMDHLQKNLDEKGQKLL